MKTFIGKFLIRRAKTTSGEAVFILTGIAYPGNFPLADISDKDEIWIARLGVLEIQKYELKEKEATGYKGSPEDFLANTPSVTSEFSEWKKKDS